MVKVSVIVPAYNVEKYLAECLDSLINQTLEDIEIIVINDGSTDCTLQILEEYAAKDRRIKIINQENAGQSVARNRGIDAAVGEYVAFVDADDWVDLDFFRKLYDAAKKENADVAAGGILFCDLNLKRRFLVKYRSQKSLYKLKEKYKYLLCNGKHCYIWNKIYHREHLLNGKLFFMDGKYYEDVFWSLQMLKVMDSAVCVPDILYYYRANPCSTVHTTKNDAKKCRTGKTLKLLDCNMQMKINWKLYFL